MTIDELFELKAADQDRRQRFKAYLDGKLTESEVLQLLLDEHIICNTYFDMLTKPSDEEK